MPNDLEIIEVLEWIKRVGTVIERVTSQTPMDEHEPLPLNQPSNAIIARRRIAARRLRDKFFGHGIFAEPAWDMMLDLYAAHYEGKDISVSSLTIAASVPATTALRWIGRLVDANYMVRQPDPTDRRKIYIALVPDMIEKLDEYFIAMREIDHRSNP